MNIILLTTTTFFCLFLTASFVVVFRKLASDGSSLLADDDWIEHVCRDRYRPMERLLDQREYEVLQSHPVFTRKMLRKFRAQRVRAFRGYLSCLSLDYSRVCSAIRALMVHSADDRPDLAGILVRQRVTFTLRFMVAEFRLSLHAVGVGNVDVAKLVSALDSMRLELNSLLAAAAHPVAA